MELDDLKATFQTLNANLERQNALNLALLREGRKERARHGLRPLVWGQALQMACGALLALPSALFWMNHRHEPRMLLTGLLFHAYGLAMILCGARMQALLARVDFGAPVVDIQKQLARLRRFYVVSGLALGLPWWLLWMPCMAMIVMGLSGVDLYARAPLLFTINTTSGLTGLLLTWVFHRWAKGRPTLARKLADTVAGASLIKAQRLLDEITSFEHE